MSKTRKRKGSLYYFFKTICIVLMFVLIYHFRMEIRLIPAAKTAIFIFAAAIFITYMMQITLIVIRRIRLLGASIKQIDKMTGEDFEIFLRDLYRQKGYKVSLTPGTMDFGGDLILKKDKKVTVIQAKRWKKKVPEAAVQQVIAAREYYNADFAKVVTNSVFTEAAVKLAERTGVILIDRKKLQHGDV